MDNTKAFHLVLRVPKADSAFLYFQFEANEGLCFYSTLPESMGQGHRDIDVKCDLSTKDEVIRLVKKLEESMPIEYLVQEEIDYSA